MARGLLQLDSVTKPIKRTRRFGSGILGCILVGWILLMAAAVDAGQGNDGFIMLLGVSTDGTTITLTPVMPQPGVIMPPPVPPKGGPPMPPILVPPPVQKPPVQHLKGVVDVFTCLNVRSGPSTDFQILGTLQAGEDVDIIGERNGWYEIEWHGRHAWICGAYVFRPGKEIRNEDIRGKAGQIFGNAALPRAQRDPTASQAATPVNGVPGGRESDGGLNVPLFNQNAIGAKYPSGFCGPTSLKMVLAYYGKNEDINHLGLDNVGGATPVYHQGVGAGHQAMLDMLQHEGLKGSYMTHGKSIQWLRDQTANGTPCVVSVAGDYGAGFHTDGHILVVAGITSSGNVILSDSAGGKRRIVDGGAFLGAWNSSNRMALVARP